MEQDSPEDLVLRLRQAQRGDFRAFEALVRQYKQRVYTAAYRILGNHHDAEDAAQEVFLKVYRSIKDLEDPAGLTGWIYRITSNTCLDMLSSRKRRPQTTPLEPDNAGEEEPNYADTQTATPEEAALLAEIRACLHAALAALDPAGRAIIVLRDVEGRSYQEIAESLVLSLSAVKMRIHRTRLAFQQLLDRLCPEVIRPGRNSSAKSA